MNSENSTGGSSDSSFAIKEGNFLDYLAVAVKWRRFILSIVLSSMVIAIIVSLLLPKVYKATASVVPPKESSGPSPFSAASSLLRGLGGSRLGSLGQSTGAYNYLAILNSRSAREAVVQRFNLFAEYKIADSLMEDALRQLDENVSIEIQKEDYITIDVTDRDPKRCAEMANFLVEELNQISIRLGTKEAHDNREFIETRVNGLMNELHLAEDSLRRYQETTGTMISPDQTATLSVVAGLYGMKARKEVELSILQRSFDSSDPAVQQVKLELQEIDRKVSAFPEVGLMSARLYENVLIRQKILEYLIPMLEQSRIDEKKDVPVILVLDKAVPAERKAGPKRLWIVLATTAASLFFALSIVFFRERLSFLNATNPEHRRKMQEIRDLMRRKKNRS